ncbi:MAG: type II secretion system protein [Hydrogenovibrio sp.]|uniref:type II secretion system protein n=1 Tax=Hydrogenovibrio sp. TaxID=2065821 RepID=UPI0028708ADA|nr:type II secretion system protein [Hydrogenovibrio sp.]MDR9498569.1 type II secretion system protein [Hydrogenovibrio sp.]
MKYPSYQAWSKTQRGFTLVEVAIALLLISILLTGVAKIFGAFESTDKGRETEQQMTEIKQALLTYLKVNGHLPCPDTDDDGIENRSNTYNTEACRDREGRLPYLDLGMAKADGWGNPFYYRVNPRSETADYVNNYCQSASVFGRKGPFKTIPAEAGLCPDNGMYYCDCSAAKADGACNSTCDFDYDPYPNRKTNRDPSKPIEEKNLAPYFLIDTPPNGVDTKDSTPYKNMEVIDNEGDTLAGGIVAMVVSFGENGDQTWQDCNLADPSEQENCNNNGEFRYNRSYAMQDFLTWVTIWDAKQAMVETGGFKDE